MLNMVADGIAGFFNMSIFLLFTIKNQLNQRWIYGTDE